jgi:hypothetical protein
MDDDFDFEEFERECEQQEKEIDFLITQMDNGFDLIELLLNLESSVERFNENMNSLNQVIESQKSEFSKNSFLYGILLAGIISAYEGFIHELFDACCNKKDYVNKALLNINKLTLRDSNYLKLKIKEKISEEDFKQKLLQATLYDPIQINRITDILFGLKMPAVDSKLFDNLIKLRNAFTHNNGYLGGEYVKLNYQDIKNVYIIFNNLINGYVNSILKESDLNLTLM